MFLKVLLSVVLAVSAKQEAEQQALTVASLPFAPLPAPKKLNINDFHSFSRPESRVADIKGAIASKIGPQQVNRALDANDQNSPRRMSREEFDAIRQSRMQDLRIGARTAPVPDSMGSVKPGPLALSRPGPIAFPLGKPAPQGAFDAFALADPRARMEAVRQQMMGGAAHTFGFDPRHFAERLSPEQAFDEIRRVHDEKEAELPQQSLSTRASDKFELSFPVIDPMIPSDPMFAVDPANPFPHLESDFELNQTLKPAHAQATGGRALEDANEQTSNDATGVVDPRTRMEAVRQQMMNGAAGSLGLHPHQFSAHMSPEEVRSAVDRLRSSKESLGQRVVEAVQAGTADLADAPMMTAGSLPVVPDMASPVAAGVALSPEEVNAEIDRIHALKEAVLQQLSGGRVENNAQQAAAQSTDATGPRLSPRSHQIGTRMSPEQIAEIERVRQQMSAGVSTDLSPEQAQAEIERVHVLKETIRQQLAAGQEVVSNPVDVIKIPISTDPTGPVAAAAADSSDLPQLTSRSQRAPAVVVADEHLTAGRQLSQSSNLRGSLTSASNGPSIVDANVIHADKIRPDFHHREVESAPAMKSSTSSDAEKKPFHALMEPLSHARGGIMKALQEVVNKLQVTN